MADLGEWLAAISCGSLREPLDDYGCETTADLLLLDPPDIAALAGSLKKVQVKKFEAALAALRGEGAAESSSGARAARAEQLPAEAPQAGAEADAAFAASAKLLTPSPLRDGAAAFDAPAPVPNEYVAEATGALVQPSLFGDAGSGAAAPTMQEVGESVYARVAADARVPSGEMAGKITGMVMAAGFGMEVLVPLMTDDAALGVKVAEALALLGDAGADAEAGPEPEPEPEPAAPAEDDEATVMLKRKAAIGLTAFTVRLAAGESTTDDGQQLDADNLVESPAFKDSITAFGEICELRRHCRPCAAASLHCILCLLQILVGMEP